MTRLESINLTHNLEDLVEVDGLVNKVEVGEITFQNSITEDDGVLVVRGDVVSTLESGGESLEVQIEGLTVTVKGVHLGGDENVGFSLDFKVGEISGITSVHTLGLSQNTL